MLKPVWQSFSLLDSRQKKIFLAIVFLRVGVHGLDLLGLAAIGVLGAMLASGLTGQSDAAFLGFSVEVTDSRNFVWVASIVAGFFLAKSTFGTLLLRVTTIFVARIEAACASELASFIFAGDIARVRSMSKGEIQWAVSMSSQIAFSRVLFAGSSLVTEAALFFAVFTAFLFVDVATALVITVYFILLIVLFQVLINRRLRRLGVRMRENSVLVNNSILDLVTAYREMTVLEKRSFFLNRFDLARHKLASDVSLQRFVGGLPRFFVESALMIGIVGMILWQFAKGNPSEGLVVLGIFLAGGFRMMAAMLPLQSAITEIRIDGPQAVRAQSLIMEARAHPSLAEDTPQSASNLVSSPSRQGLEIEARDLAYQYVDSDRPALRGASFQIRAGSFVAFIGPSGAGKTTLVDLTLGLLLPTSGKIEIDGQTPEDLRRAHPGLLSYVPQNPGMVSGTIAENVALGVEPTNIEWDRVDRALEQAGLGELMKTLPLGSRTDLGEQSDALSGGQLQRLGIARALYTAPQLLVLDEATSALDADTEAAVAETLYRLRGQVTVIVVAHRLSTIQHADRVFVVEEGSISADGTFADVRKQVPLVERYVQLLNISEGGPGAA